MSTPDIVFTEEDKDRLQKLALELESTLLQEAEETKHLVEFINYPPFVNAIHLAKSRLINKPLDIYMNYWYFDSPLAEWFFSSRSSGSILLIRFIRLISGFPSNVKS